MFELFDPKQEYVVREGRLPHWYQPGVTYFVTFRTEDSVPQSLVSAWHRKRDEWLQRQGLDPTAADWKARLHALPDAEREYHDRFTRAFMEYLDRGYGECLLRDAAAADIVARALRCFDADRYHLGDFVVMPNHVHLVVCLLGETRLEAQCRSWKRFSAGELNAKFGRRGRFWQEESFDHLVRSAEQFEYFERYIAENPRKARLNEGQYLHGVRKPK